MSIRQEIEDNSEFDAIIIGAGVAGLYQLYKLLELNIRVLVLEAGTNVGGTWYWNRYPGARFDSESFLIFQNFQKNYCKSGVGRNILQHNQILYGT